MEMYDLVNDSLLASGDDAIERAVTCRCPDREVPAEELAWWFGLQERLETRAELAAAGLLAPSEQADGDAMSEVGEPGEGIVDWRDEVQGYSEPDECDGRERTETTVAVVGPHGGVLGFCEDCAPELFASIGDGRC